MALQQMHLVTEIDFVDGDEASGRGRRRTTRSISRRPFRTRRKGLSLRTIKSAHGRERLDREIKKQALAGFRPMALANARQRPAPSSRRAPTAAAKPMSTSMRCPETLTVRRPALEPPQRLG